MRLAAVSALVGTFQRNVPSHAIHEANLLEFALCTPGGMSIDLHCRINVRQPGKPFKLIAKNRRNQTQKTLAFSVPNEHNETAIDNSDASAEDQVILPLENNQSLKQPDVETVVSALCSEEDLSENIECLGDLGSLLQQLKSVHAQILASEMWNASRLKLCHRNYLHSATNLVHYLALKCPGIGQLKEDLASVGLLNLETINSSVLENLNACILLLENLKSNPVYAKVNRYDGLGSQEKPYHPKKRSFRTHAIGKKVSLDRESLLGVLRGDRQTHIMVTIGEEALESETLITDLLKAGTSIVRINCAHGDADIWDEIIRRVKRSSQMLEAPCRILMDLAGPKLRTANLQPGPCVIKISAKKNATGNVICPAQVWLSHRGAGAPPPHLSPDAVLFIDDQQFLSDLEVGDTLTFYDARGKKRMLKISRACHVLSSTGFIAECSRTAYVMSGTKLHVKRKKRRFPVGQVVDVPARDPFVRLKVGDLLIISRNSLSEQDELSQHASDTHKIACSSSYLFDSVQPGERIAFDDGKIWGVIQGTSISEIVVLVTHAGPRGTKLRSQKSINIPDSKIQFEGLTLKDLTDLEFVSSHADMLGVSFVQDTRDIILLYQELERRKLHNLGIVLKIETKSGFKKLPAILLEAMKHPNPLGVMIARGDLAVECGWESLADIQEEILSICGAAHIPVIWATQVLDSLVKTGVPTRAEVTDVACGRRASCIMLNKGSHVVEAVSTLDKILSINSKDTKAELKTAVFPDYLLGRR